MVYLVLLTTLVGFYLQALATTRGDNILYSGWKYDVITCDNPIVYSVLLTTLVGLYLQALTARHYTTDKITWCLAENWQEYHSFPGQNHMPFGANVPAYHIIIACIPQLKYPWIHLLTIHSRISVDPSSVQIGENTWLQVGIKQVHGDNEITENSTSGIISKVTSVYICLTCLHGVWYCLIWTSDDKGLWTSESECQTGCRPLQTLKDLTDDSDYCQNIGCYVANSQDW